MSRPPPLDVTLRRARPSDAEALRAFKRQLLTETELLLQGPEDWRDELPEEVALIGRFDAHPGSLLLLALQGQEVLGMCTVVPGPLIRNRHVAQLGMGVLRRCWRRGIGGAMLDRAIRWARDRADLHKLSLQVHEHNEPARRLYLASGFQYEGVLRDEALCDGRYVDLLAMGLILR